MHEYRHIFIGLFSSNCAYFNTPAADRADGMEDNHVSGGYFVCTYVHFKAINMLLLRMILIILNF